jgi:hypothetical protein
MNHPFQPITMGVIGFMQKVDSHEQHAIQFQRGQNLADMNWLGQERKIKTGGTKGSGFPVNFERR